MKTAVIGTAVTNLAHGQNLPLEGNTVINMARHELVDLVTESARDLHPKASNPEKVNIVFDYIDTLINGHSCQEQQLFQK